MRGRGAAAVALFLSLSAATASAATDEVPLMRTGHGRALVVEASVNGRFTGRFLLDTGATLCVVSKDTARRAMIKGRAGGSKIHLTTPAGVIEATLAEAYRIEVGSASARDVEVAVVDEDPTPGLDGLLGLSFLNRFSYSVDPEKGVLRLRR
ncbi:MAG: retroviral-like aspartic protease family protein [Deltaproteobacteria bacterium]|nr:retroviral-like aspartic protease family protein [Deltaproteobacteria bacterium]